MKRRHKVLLDAAHAHAGQKVGAVVALIAYLLIRGLGA